MTQQICVRWPHHSACASPNTGPYLFSLCCKTEVESVDWMRRNRKECLPAWGTSWWPSSCCLQWRRSVVGWCRWLVELPRLAGASEPLCVQHRSESRWSATTPSDAILQRHAGQQLRAKRSPGVCDVYSSLWETPSQSYGASPAIQNRTTQQSYMIYALNNYQLQFRCIRMLFLFYCVCYCIASGLPNTVQ